MLTYHQRGTKTRPAATTQTISEINNPVYHPFLSSGEPSDSAAIAPIAQVAIENPLTHMTAIAIACITSISFQLLPPMVESPSDKG